MNGATEFKISELDRETVFVKSLKNAFSSKRGGEDCKWPARRERERKREREKKGQQSVASYFRQVSRQGRKMLNQ